MQWETNQTPHHCKKETIMTNHLTLNARTKLPSEISTTLEMDTTLYGALYANPAHVASILNRLGTTHKARHLAAIETITAYVWHAKMPAGLPVTVLSMESDRNVVVQYADGTINRVRAQRLWDKPAHPRTGLPYGQKWLDKIIAREIDAKL